MPKMRISSDQGGGCESAFQRFPMVHVNPQKHEKDQRIRSTHILEEGRIDQD